jgi:hypothetical protein
MIWKRYRNELIVFSALLFALGSFMYKLSQHTAKAEANQKMAKEVALFQETVSLKSIWGDKQIWHRLESVRKLVPENKVSWMRKGRRLTATFRDLTGPEVNRLVTRLLNIAVQVESLRITKNGERYSMEIRCKW